MSADVSHSVSSDNIMLTFPLPWLFFHTAHCKAGATDIWASRRERMFENKIPSFLNIRPQMLHFMSFCQRESNKMGRNPNPDAILDNIPKKLSDLIYRFGAPIAPKGTKGLVNQIFTCRNIYVGLMVT